MALRNRELHARNDDDDDVDRVSDCTIFILKEVTPLCYTQSAHFGQNTRVIRSIVFTFSTCMRLFLLVNSSTDCCDFVHYLLQVSRWAVVSLNRRSEMHVSQIGKVNVEINQLFEKRMVADSSDDKLTLFRQQACLSLVLSLFRNTAAWWKFHRAVHQSCFFLLQNLYTMSQEKKPKHFWQNCGS